MTRQVLVMTAHADDAEFWAGGTLARLAAAGDEITCVIATDNCRGTLRHPMPDMIERSAQEARRAAQVLGMHQVVFLGYADGELREVPTAMLRGQFMGFARRLRPGLALTFDSFAPFETHPDHRAVAVAASEALSFSQLPHFHPEHLQGGVEIYQVPEVYYFAKHPVNADLVLDVSDFIQQKIDALCQHISQMELWLDELRLALESRGDALRRDDYQVLLGRHIRHQAAQVGKKIGVPFAEAFRRDGPVSADLSWLEEES